MSLPISGVIDVSISVTPSAPAAATFDKGRVFGAETVLPYWDRVRSYADITEVLVDFNSSTEIYKAASAYFGGSPAPDVLQVGRIFTTAQSAVLRSGVASDVVADYTGITAGGFDITINGTNRQISAINCGAATTMANVATAIQTRLAVALASTTCTWDATQKRFIITSPTTGTGSLIGFGSTPTAAGPPTDTSATFKLTNATGAKFFAGCALEDATAMLAASAIVDPNYYAIGLTSAFTAQQHKDTGAYVESAKKKFFYTTSDGNALSTGDTTNLGYYFKNIGYKRSVGFYSSSTAYAAIAAMARELIVDYDQPNSAITLKFKQLTGVATEAITTAQASALNGYNLNYYVDRGGFSMVEQGEVAADGYFSDEITGWDWIEATVQSEVAAVLFTARSKIPQTDEGVAKITMAIDRALGRAVNAGILAPGVWTGDDVGEVESGDLLPKGYYTYAQPVAEQSAAARAARQAPTITSICCGAGAIHSAAIAINFQR